MSMRGDAEMPYWVDATGAGWLSQPVMLHSSRETSCDMTAEQCAFKWQHWLNWYKADFQYALPTIAFILSVIAFCAIGSLGDLIVPSSIQRWSIYRRIQALARFLSQRSFRIALLGFYLPSLGVLLVMSVGLIFFMAVMLGKQPYYWPNTDQVSYGDSPPIATRTGWMSLACLPFVLSLAAKENPISVLTRVSYEKLNVFHRYLSWMMYLLALVHTFPFIVVHIKKGDMGMQWGMGAYYWTGVVALLAQSWLSFMSIRWIRNRFYELFKATHIIAAMMFFAFLFIHCGFTLTSVDYLIASAVLYFLCWSAASLRTFFEHGPGSIPARLELLRHNVVKMTVPTSSPWKPGQHIFLRFLGWNLHALTAHPFTISSLPLCDDEWTIQDEHQMVFYIHPRRGYTARLAALARQHQNSCINVMLDGPYGGMKDRSLAAFERAVVIAGGAGASFVLPVVEDVLRRRTTGTPIDLKVVFSTRSAEQAAWFQEELAALLKDYQTTTVTIAVHVTGNTTLAPTKPSYSDEKSHEMITERERDSTSDSDSERLAKPMLTGRPDTKAVLEGALKDFRGGLGVAVCGPESMLFDVRNAVADAQTRVGRGGAREVYLYSEHFGW